MTLRIKILQHPIHILRRILKAELISACGQMETEFLTLLFGNTKNYGTFNWACMEQIMAEINCS